MIRPRPAVSTIVFGAAAAGGVVLSSVVARREILLTRWSILTVLAVWVPLWVVGGTASKWLPRRGAFALIAVAAIAIRLAALGHAPSLSDDVHRYAWDAKVQSSGIDPYESPPDSPELVRLHDSFLWPDDATCVSLHRSPGCTRINRPSERTIYPPVAQAWFVIVRTASLGSNGVVPWQAAAALVDLGLCGLLALGLRRSGRDPVLVAWWALSPVAVVEIVGNAHVDGVAALLCVAAVIAARRRPALAGALVGAAAMVKLYPAVLLVAVARRHPFRALSAFTAVVVLTELPHVIAVGPRILGYLPGYLREEKYDGGGRFLLLNFTRLPGEAVIVVAVVVLLVALAALWWADLPPERSAPLAIAAVLLVATPVQPWYAVSVAALGILIARPAMSVLTIAAWPYFFAVILDHPDAGLYGRVGYGASLATVVVLAVADFGQYRRPGNENISAWPPTTMPATGPSPPATHASTVDSAPRS